MSSEGLHLLKRALASRGIRDVVGSASMRAFILPLSGIASVISSRLVVEATGASGFAVFTLLITLGSLVPISDFGISAAITDAIAKNGLASREFARVWQRCSKLLLWIAVMSASVAAVIAAVGGWSIVLGLEYSIATEIAAVLMITIMGAGIALGPAQRLLLAVGNQTLVTSVISAGSVISLCATALAFSAGQKSALVYAVAFGSGPLVAQLMLYLVAMWKRRKAATEALSSGVTPEKEERVSIAAAAWPMAVLSIALPLTFQSDRVVISHILGLAEVASYSVVSLLFSPLLSIISAGQLPLWPLFMSRLAKNESVARLYYGCLLGGTLLGAFLAASLFFVGPFISHFVGAGQVEAAQSLYASFSILIFVFGVHAASGMLLMDMSGRVIQAVGAVAMLALKILLTFWLAPQMGAAGAVVATLIAVVLAMLLPCVTASILKIRRIENARLVDGVAS